MEYFARKHDIDFDIPITVDVAVALATMILKSLTVPYQVVLLQAISLRGFKNPKDEDVNRGGTGFPEQVLYRYLGT